MSNSKDLQDALYDLEERMNNKLRILFKYKTVILTLKIIIFTSMACLLFVRSGKNHDIYLWFIGIFMTIMAVAELFELEELRFYIKDNKKVSEKTKDNV